MSQQDLFDYVMNTPHNTNPAILKQKIKELSDASSSQVGGSTEEEWIGDGNTHIWITLHEGRTSPMLGVCPKGTVTVDWGDGTTPDVLTGTSTSTVKRTPTHEYASAGEYVISLTVDGIMCFADLPGLLCHSSSRDDDRNYLYKSSIQRIEIGDNVTSIDKNAFCYCHSLASINIPNNVTSIGENAFYHCHSLASINIPNNVTSIGESAFYSCYSLASINIPNSVTSIGDNTFNDCYSLASVIIPNSVTSIGKSAFCWCYSLASVTIPNNVTSIGQQAFDCCHSLTSVTIPNNVTSIGKSAFYRCYSLASINIPNSVTSIGDNAFFNCNGIRYYDFSKHTVVPVLSNTNAFGDIAADCEIRVPTALYDEWIAATNWATYASKIVAV